MVLKNSPKALEILLYLHAYAELGSYIMRNIIAKDY